MNSNSHSQTTLSSKEIRQQLRTLRQQLSAEQQLKNAQRALNHLKTYLSSQISQPAKIALFLAQDGELDTQSSIEYLWQETLYEVYLPVLDTQADWHMGFCRFEKNSTLKPNQFGILEPDLPIEKHLTGEQLDLVIMPLVGFDSSGNRLGMGGGYYDRTFEFKKKLSHSKPKLIGWAHQCQEYRQIPSEPWDIPLDGLITENGFFEWKR